MTYIRLESLLFFVGFPVMLVFRETRRPTQRLKLVFPLYTPISKMKLPANDYIPAITRYCTKLWQQSWDALPTNKLKAIKPVL